MEFKCCLLFVFGSYILISRVLARFPLFKNQNLIKLKKKFYVISHRGGAGERVENTLDAFQHCVNINVDILELDCQLTKDGHVVVCHDNNLSRVCGVNELISELNYDNLPPLLPKLLDSNETINKKLQNTCQIPSLDEIFQKFPKTVINLDIKVNNDELIKKVNDLLIKYNRQDLTIWGSFMEDVTRKCHQLNPSVPKYFSLKGCIKIFILTITGLLPFVPLKESYFEIVYPDVFLQSIRFEIPFLWRIMLRIAKIVFIRKSFIQELRLRGISVFVWVLNSDEDFSNAIELGVNGIITDNPSRLIQFLNSNYSHKQAE